MLETYNTPIIIPNIIIRSTGYKDAVEAAASRTLAARELLHFTTYTYPAYNPDPAHYLIAAVLDRVLAGEIKRLMIFAPPQHGKTELVSVRFPPFWLAHKPNKPVILTSYGASLAHSKCAEARDVVRQVEYKQLFDKVIDPRNAAGNSWKILGMPAGMRSAGVRGPITGHGAGLGLIDDPFEGWEQAQSKTIREGVYRWYKGTFRTRIWKDAPIVLIMTRWHEEDLAGKIISKAEYEDITGFFDEDLPEELLQEDDWEILRLPAIAENQEERDIINEEFDLPQGLPDPVHREKGEALCPQRYNIVTLAKILRDVGTTVFNAEYQGFPMAPEGAIIKREWIKQQETITADVIARVRFWDKAATAGAGNYTVGLLMAVAKNGAIYIEDMKRGQWSSKDRDTIIKSTSDDDALQYGDQGVDIVIEEEGGSSGKDSSDALIILLAGYKIKNIRPTGSKEIRGTRPGGLASQAEAGNVIMIKAGWNKEWLGEICSFPFAANDDIWDSTTGGLNYLTLERQRILAKATKASPAKVVKRGELF